MTGPFRARWLPLAAYALVCIAAVEMARLIDDPSVLGSFPALWPLSGVAIAALLATGRRAWPSLLLIACGTMLLSSVIHGGLLLTATAAAAIFGLQSAATALAIRRQSADRPFALDRLPHAVALVGAAVIVPLAGGLLAGVILMQRQPHLILPVWRTWWLADMIGMLLTAPMALAAIEMWRRRAMPRASEAIEFAFVLIGAVVVTEGVLGGRFGPLLQVPAYILPFLLWPVFRIGPAAGSVTTFLVGFLALWHAARGEGVLAQFTDSDIVLRTQGGMSIAAASVLLLSSVVAERRRVAHERNLLVAELQHALAQIKTLEGFIPICAWCHKVRDDAGFWQQLEKYLDDNTGATVSHSICPTCTEAARREIEAHEAQKVS